MFVNRNSQRESRTLVQFNQQKTFFLSYHFGKLCRSVSVMARARTQLSGSVFTMRLKVAAEGEGEGSSLFAAYSHVALFVCVKPLLSLASCLFTHK